MKIELQSRKLIFAVILLVIGTIALFMNIASFTEWAAFMTVINGIYGTTNILEKRNNANTK